MLDVLAKGPPAEVVCLLHELVWTLEKWNVALEEGISIFVCYVLRVKLSVVFVELIYIVLEDGLRVKQRRFKFVDIKD